MKTPSIFLTIALRSYWVGCLVIAIGAVMAWRDGWAERTYSLIIPAVLFIALGTLGEVVLWSLGFDSSLWRIGSIVLACFGFCISFWICSRLWASRLSSGPESALWILALVAAYFFINGIFIIYGMLKTTSPHAGA